MTLTRLFVLTTLVLALVGGATFYAFFAVSERAIVARSAERREAVASRVEQRTDAELDVAVKAVGDIDRAIQFASVRLDDVDAVEARLFSELLDNVTLSDVSLTHADAGGFAWETSVFRASSDASSAIWTRRVRRDVDRSLVAELRRRPPSGGLLAVPFEREPGTPTDPTTHATYEVPLDPANRGRLIWSDLSHWHLDSTLPAEQQRIVLSLQKSVNDAGGQPFGVLRAALLARTIDAIPRLGAEDVDPGGPAQVFLSDDKGRLLTRIHPDDTHELFGADLRVPISRASPEVAAALQRPGQEGTIDVGGAKWLVTSRKIPNSQDWVVGVVVPEAYYTRDLRELRDRFLLMILALTVTALVVGVIALRPVRRSLARVIDATSRMRRFELAPAPADAPLREVAEVMEGVERAKTSMRTLGKYVPMDLVRELYTANREPELGGELVELSMMFTDIEGFTGLSERLAPDALARALGAYLEAMTAGVRSTEGTVDKFIGDAVMAFWNAPRRFPDHPLRACRAALACMKAVRALYASPAWEGLPPLFTRYGLHTARVMVGNFGAPTRLSYTALGDGVNLAARLEPLCKQYGVAALASQAVVEAVAGANDAPAFRLVDTVAVKGKHEAVRVYELLEGARTETVERYEEAFAAYLARDFGRARDALLALPGDPPSRVLCARCVAMMADPPRADWNGVYVATSK
ncbi:MAG TPA: adenylate/guanylate cyclase domain-containing protein [Polyangiaceae bacterium]